MGPFWDWRSTETENVSCGSSMHLALWDPCNIQNGVYDLTMETGPAFTTKGNPGQDHCDTLTVLFFTSYFLAHVALLMKVCDEVFFLGGGWGSILSLLYPICRIINWNLRLPGCDYFLQSPNFASSSPLLCGVWSSMEHRQPFSKVDSILIWWTTVGKHFHKHFLTFLKCYTSTVVTTTPQKW